MTQSEHAKARAAGMTPTEAARGLAYVAKMRAEGREPIDVHEAVRQIREVRP